MMTYEEFKKQWLKNIPESTGAPEHLIEYFCKNDYQRYLEYGTEVDL